ncbi:MAG: YfhL family 4Fe-4S dicluster ferredoxin [Dehalococcoidia bacterium]|nr:YfhL family 4Fe-4S dicluster ferredoxin [Dehalococcoidia bacterium]
MSYKISEDCISCGACESECPNKAIKEGRDIYEIDTVRCSECIGSFTKPQCSEICPVGAPVPDLSNQESREQLIAKWEQLHPIGETPKA